MEKPKPCPFCGHEPDVIPWIESLPDKHLVACSSLDCKAHPVVSGDNINEAIEFWNRRAE